MTVATITSKGQVTIPVDIRRACGLEPGAKVDFVYQPNDRQIIMMPRRKLTLLDLYGSITASPDPDLDPDDGVGQALAEDDERIRTSYNEWLASR